MIEQYNKIVNKIFIILGNIVLLVLVAVTFYQVIMRYIFSHSLPWADEFLRFIYAWMTLFGLLSGTQIQISLLRDRISKSISWIFSEFCYLIILFCVFILLHGALKFFFLTRNDYYAAFDMSISWFYFPLIICSILEIIRIVLTMIHNAMSRQTGEL